MFSQYILLTPAQVIFLNQKSWSSQSPSLKPSLASYFLQHEVETPGCLSLVSKPFMIWPWPVFFKLVSFHSPTTTVPRDDLSWPVPLHKLFLGVSMSFLVPSPASSKQGYLLLDLQAKPVSLFSHPVSHVGTFTWTQPSLPDLSFALLSDSPYQTMEGSGEKRTGFLNPLYLAYHLDCGGAWRRFVKRMEIAKDPEVAERHTWSVITLETFWYKTVGEKNNRTRWRLQIKMRGISGRWSG